MVSSPALTAKLSPDLTGQVLTPQSATNMLAWGERGHPGPWPIPLSSTSGRGFLGLVWPLGLSLCLEMFALMVSSVLERAYLGKRSVQALEVGLRSLGLGILQLGILGEHIASTAQTSFSVGRATAGGQPKGAF